MGTEGFSFEKALKDFKPREEQVLTVNGKTCKVFTQDSNSWNVYIDAYLVTVTQSTDGKLKADDTSSFSKADSVSKERRAVAVQAVTTLLSQAKPA